MRVGLLFADRDLELDALAEPDPELVADLELDRIFAAMAAGDAHVRAVVRRVLPAGLQSPAAVEYRQAVVADALASPGLVRELYRLAADAVDAERRVWGGGLRNAELVLRRSVEVLGALLDAVERARDTLGRDRASLRSAGMLALADRLASDVDDTFLAAARDGLRQLDDDTLVVTAGLGPGNRPARFLLRRHLGRRDRLRDRVTGAGPRGMAVEVALRDQNAMNALAELRASAVAPAAEAVSDAAGQLLGFCRRLRDEAAFLVGCINLDRALAEAGAPRVTPRAARRGQTGIEARGIVDPCLVLMAAGPVVGNTVSTADRPLTVVTGANGGGKSTLLRAAGVSRLMLAGGVQVAADDYAAGLPTSVLTHFPRPERAGGGLLEAELERLAALVGRARPGSLVLLNEPLSSVNERDASAIARELVAGLVAGGAEVWLVTHHHELALSLHERPPAPAAFLRAARGSGHERPFTVTEAPPLATSFGTDLWLAEVDGGQPGSSADVGTIS